MISKRLDGFYNLFRGVFRISLYESLILYLLIIGLAEGYNLGFSSVYLQLVIAVLTASILDLGIMYLKHRKLSRPYTAIISGLFIGLTLAPGIPLHIPMAAGVIAVVSKHIIRIKKRNLFNPAILGLFMVGIFLQGHSSWWVASPVYLVIPLGILIVLQLRRISLVFTYYISFALTSALITFIILHGDFLQGFLLANIFVFFMFFMLTEPRTSPVNIKGRVVYGLIAGILNPAFFLLYPYLDASFASLLIANLFVPALNRYFKV